MRPAVLSSLICLVFGLAGGGCDAGEPPPLRDAGSDGGSLVDSDGDGISDEDEGASSERDTDGDGTPDAMDSDSDGDGIPDSVEAGDDDTRTPPVDSDGDGIPDFIDLDSDDNGIPDANETDGDVDADGVPDFADLDDDNDIINDATELDGVFDPPVDTDGDGLPDYQDPDSDNDFILDGHERDLDTDGDGIPDVADLDSDDDGIQDEHEAGDDDIRTLPIDTDGDGTPDFRDFDSDNDGLSDLLEWSEYGTSPTNDDSDGDGVSDLIEVAAGSDPLDMEDSPRTRGDFVFIVPYMEDPSPPRDTLTFRTSISFADIYFLFDASGSMGGEQDNLAAGVSMIMDNLTCADTGLPCLRDSECTPGNVCSPFSGTCIEDPGMSSCVASAFSGTGQYGQSAGSGNLMINRTSLQGDPIVTRAGIDLIPVDGGTEPLFGAIWAVVGGPLPSPMPTQSCGTPGPGLIGCPNFRNEAVRILIAFSDEDSDGSVTAQQAADALTATGVTFIGVYSSTAARPDMDDVATRSNSLNAAGDPLTFLASASGTGIADVVTNAINEIVEGVPLRVTIDAVDQPGDAGDALQFIQALETNTTGTGCSAIGTEDANPAGDGIQDTYPVVTPGTPVCFDVVPRRNETVMPERTPLVYEARLTVYGDGSPLDSRKVFFLVPPDVTGPIGPD